MPALNAAGDTRLIEELRATHQDFGDILLCGEAASDLQCMEYSLSYFRIGAGHVALHRYLDPFYPMMVAVTGYDDREQLNSCLLYRYLISYEPLNFKGRLDDYPLTMEYGKRIDALRRRHRAYLWDAEFRDVLGAHVTAPPGAAVRYSVFRQADTGRCAVCVANDDASKPVEADVSIDGRPAARLERLSPEAPDPVATDARILVPPRSVAVVWETS